MYAICHSLAAFFKYALMSDLQKSDINKIHLTKV